MVTEGEGQCLESVWGVSRRVIRGIVWDGSITGTWFSFVTLQPRAKAGTPLDVEVRQLTLIDLGSCLLD